MITERDYADDHTILENRAAERNPNSVEVSHLLKAVLTYT